MERRGDDLAAEVLRVVGGQHVEEHVAREHVDAHRGDERLVSRVGGEHGPRRDAALDVEQTALIGLLLEGDDVPAAVEAEDPHLAGVFGRHRLGRDGDVRAVVDVCVDHLVEVHPVQVVASEDQVVVHVVAHLGHLLGQRDAVVPHDELRAVHVQRLVLPRALAAEEALDERPDQRLVAGGDGVLTRLVDLEDGPA